MIDYLTHPKFLNYDPSILPSSQGGGTVPHTSFYSIVNTIKELPLWDSLVPICSSAIYCASSVGATSARDKRSQFGEGSLSYSLIGRLVSVDPYSVS